MSIDDILRTLELACVASCGCLTKTPDFQHHAADCRYRVLSEAVQYISEQHATIANQAKVFLRDSLTIVDQRKRVREVQQELQSYRTGAEAEIAQLRQLLSGECVAYEFAEDLRAAIDAARANCQKCGLGGEWHSPSTGACIDGAVRSK